MNGSRVDHQVTALLVLGVHRFVDDLDDGSQQCLGPFQTGVFAAQRPKLGDELLLGQLQIRFVGVLLAHDTLPSDVDPKS